MEDIIKSIHEVYGDELPSSKSEYCAITKSPVPMLQITKKFKTWPKFVKEYTNYCITLRNSEIKIIKKAGTNGTDRQSKH